MAEKILLKCFFLIIFCSACSSKDEEPLQPEPSPTDFHICWKVQSVSNLHGRALMSGTSLQSACTPDENGTSESIGVWGSYTLTADNSTTTLFDEVPLTYAEKTDGTDNNPFSSWNYPGDAKIWERNATYLFRACFPQTTMTSLMTEITPLILQGPVNTLEVQEDLLVASAYVDTRTADLSQPVPLELDHVFAALSFSAQAEEGYNPNGDAVTSCWLQNQSEATDLFATSGYLVYSGNETSTIVWYPYESNTAPMYTWTHDAGLTFNSTDKTLLYTENAENAYTGNDGWLLVVPQSVKANSLHFNYTLKNAPGKVFSNALPAIEYQAGYKYSYVLMIGGADATLTLTIAPWNQLDSSHNIDL